MQVTYMALCQLSNINNQAELEPRSPWEQSVSRSHHHGQLNPQKAKEV